MVSPGVIKLFNNHAWIEYHQIVDDNPLPRKLKSVDRENPQVGETQFIAIGVAPLDTVKTSIATTLKKYSADTTITVTVTINNPNTDAIPDSWLDVTFDAGFTYAGGFSSTGITPTPVTPTQIGDSLLSIAGDGNANGFTIPGHTISTFTFKLKAPTFANLVTIKDENNEEIISPLKIEYIFTTLTNDLCLLSSTENMSGMLEIPYQSLIANDDYASTISEITVIIPILDNDSVPANCTPEIEIITQQQHGVVNIVNDTIHYTSNVGYAGFDSLEYQISCNGDTATAKVYIYVAEMPDNIDTANCFVDPTGYTWGMTGIYSNEHNLSPYQTVLVGDIDGDGIVEIIASADPVELETVNTEQRQAMNIAIYKGNNIKAQPTIIATTKGYSWDYRIKYGLLRTKINNKDTTLIVVAEYDRHLRAYNYNGGMVWESQAEYHLSQNNGVPPAFADLNHDGIPEIAVAGSLFNSVDGALIYKIPTTGPEAYQYINTGQSLEVQLVDVFGDGNIKYVIGNHIYDVVIDGNNAITSLALNRKISFPRGTAISQLKSLFVDMDHDGKLDFVMAYHNNAANNTEIYIADPFTDTIKADTTIITAMTMGYPFVGDVDNDGDNEIILITGGGTADNSLIYCYKYTPGNPKLYRFWTLKHTDASNVTGITLFDFNQDGKAELVYRDEYYLRIIDGTNPSPDMASELNRSGTSGEYPVVADVDGDGQAEIIIVGGLASDNDGVEEDYKKSHILGRLWVYKSEYPATAPWAPARKVWNQNSYHPLYVNEDLSIPQYPLNPATFFPGINNVLGDADDVQPYNNFLQQQTTIDSRGLPFWLAADATFAATPVFNYHGDGDSLTITVEIKNTGDAGLQAPFYVSAYKEAVAPSNKIATDSSITTINPGITQPVTVTIRKLSSYLPLGKIIIRLNDRGDAAYVQTECDSSNNEYEFPVDKLPMAFNDTASMLYNTDTTIDVKGNDQIPDDCSAVVPSYTNPANGSITLVGDKIKYTPNIDFYGVDSFVYSLSCTSGDTVSKAEAKVYIIVNKPAYPAPYIGCIGDPIKTGFEHITDVDYYWYTTETLGSPSGDSPISAPARTAPSVWWVEVRYKGKVFKPRFKITIEAESALTAGTIDGDQAVCYGVTPTPFTSLTAASGGDNTPTYQWQDSSGVSTWQNIEGETSEGYTPTAGLTMTTKYRRAATNNCGTVYTDPITVIVYPLPVVTLNFQAICIGTSAILPSPSNGMWQNNSSQIISMDNNNVITGIATGQATFVFTDNLTGCSANISIMVDTFPVADEITGQQFVCIGQDIELSNTSANGSWSVNNSNAIITNTTANTATVQGVTQGKSYISYRVDNGICQTKKTFLLKILSNTPPEIRIGIER
jgi:hypothetical protein